MANTTGATIRFEVLGPLRVQRNGIAVALGPLQQRVVLAVLLLHANRSIGREQLINAVWGLDYPTHAVNLVQRHVSALRRVLEPDRSARAASDTVIWTDGGYQLAVAKDALDLERFDGRIDQARTARADGDLPQAAEALHEALRLWRGPACEGLVSPFLDAQRSRLAERHISALEERIDLDLALGNHLDVIAELRHLVADHPLRERLHGLLMSALYRAGRQADALAAYQDARRHLLDEVGVAPAPPLQRLQQQILAADPTIAGPEPVEEIVVGASPIAVRPATPAPVPAQLPHGLAPFIGRDAEVDRLNALLTGNRDEIADAVVITAIVGMAGVGKTALAVHWGHQIRDRFPDGQLYLNLRGCYPADPAMQPSEAVRQFLDALEVAPDQIPASLDGRAALYRSLLAGRRVLIVLDNACDAEQVRPLLPGAPGCLVVVTSRNQLTSLVAIDGAHLLALDLLSTAEARRLLAHRLDHRRVAVETDAVEDIIAFCANLPLALSIVAARASRASQFFLGQLADELRAADGGLDAFDGGDQVTNLRVVFSWSYQQLGAAAARLFRLLSLHRGPDFSTPAVASLAGLAPAGVRPLLAELARAHLITEPAPGRYRLHYLLRACASELAERHDSDSERREALHRLLEHYLHSAYHADQLLRSGQDAPVTLAQARPKVRPEPIGDHRQAMAWFGAEHRVLLAALGQAVEDGFDEHAWQLAWTMTSFLDRRGYWHDAAGSQRSALAAAERLGDRRAQAISHGALARACLRLNQQAEAHSHALQALELYDELGQPAGQAAAHWTLAWVLDRRHKYPEALSHAQLAVQLFGASGHRAGRARALNAVGWCHTQLGDHAQALAYCHRALDLQRDLVDRCGQGSTLSSIGRAHHRLGHHGQAAGYYQQALGLYREFGDRYNEASALASLGEADLAVGDPDSAAAAWQNAIAILDELGHPQAVKLRARLARLAGLTRPVLASWRRPIGPPLEPSTEPSM